MKFMKNLAITVLIVILVFAWAHVVNENHVHQFEVYWQFDGVKHSLVIGQQ